MLIKNKNYFYFDFKILKISIILIFLNFIKSNFLKNLIYNYKIFFNNSNSFWNYINILNESNNSVFFLISLFNIFVFWKNLNFFKKYNFIIIILFYNICCFKFILKKTYFLIKNNYFFNINLINGVVLIHPIYIYVTYSIIIIFNFLINQKVKKNLLINIININKKKIFYYSFVALYLGCYWAQQELNWGGWWNWDFVEIIALIFFLISSYLNHLNLNKKLNLILDFKINSIFYIFIFYFLVRLDVLNSIHSFNSFLITKTYFFWFMLIIINILIYLVFFKIINKFKYKKHNLIDNYIIFFFKFFIFLYINYILFNIFYSYLKNIQFIEITKYIKNINVFLIFLTSINIINNKQKLIFCLLFIILIIILKFNFYFYLKFIILNLIIFLIYNIKIKNNKIKFIKNILYHLIFIILTLYVLIKKENMLNNTFNFIDLNIEYLNNLNLLNFYENKNFIDLNYNSYINNYYNNNLKNYFYFNKSSFLNCYFQEILINNILLYNNNLYILYDIEDNNILILNFNKIYFILILILLIFFINKTHYFLSKLINFLKMWKFLKN